MKTPKLLAVVLTVGALSLSACGGAKNDQGSGGGASEEPSIAPISSQDINPKDRASLQQGGTIRFPISAFVPNWNPLHIDGNEDEATGARNPILPLFVLFDAKGNYTFNPDYVLSATETSKNPTTVEWKLNPKAIWGDGSPVNGADMIAMWKACSGENTKFNCASHDGFDQIANVKTGTDKFDVIVTFKASYPDWTQPFTGVVKAESIKDPDTFNKGWTELRNDWLSGPYKVQSFDKTQKVLTEVPNEKWWGNKPLLDKITFREIATSEWPKAFASNAIDAFDIGPNPDGFKTASGVQDATIRKAAGPNFRHITFNTKAGLLQDLAIRHAIVRGLDRAAIGASDLAGIDWPVRPLNNHILLENQAGYVDTAKATGLDYDPDKAKSDLDAAGWKVGADGIREKDGKKLEVKFTQIADVPVSENEGLQVQNQLKEIGIKVDLITSPTDKFFPSVANHEFELTAFTWVGTPYPYIFISQIYGTGSSSNYAQLSLPEVDKLATEIKQEPDLAKRQELAAQADKIIWENVHTLTLYQRPELVAVKTKIANYGAFGLSHNAFKWEDVGFEK